MTHLKSLRRTAKPLKRLRKVFKSTGPWRDSQVKHDWLMEYAKRTGEEWSLAPLLRELEEAQGQGRAEAVEGFKEGFEKAARRLRGRLAKESGGLERRGLRGLAKEGAKRLAVVRCVDDAKRLHRARIAVKKLRYALEPFSRHARAVVFLKNLQALLGELNDRDMVAGMLQAADEGGLADPGALRKACAALEEERRALFLKARRRGLGAPEKMRNLV